MHINKDKLIEALHHGRNASSYRHTVEYYSAVKMNEPQKQAIMAELVVAVLTNHNKLSGLNNHYLFNAQLNKCWAELLILVGLPHESLVSRESARRFGF